MEDYFWILILGAFWLFEMVSKGLKRKGRQSEVVPASTPPVADRRAEKIRRRRETFEAIASMLVAPPEEAQQAPITRQQPKAERDRDVVAVSQRPTLPPPVTSTSRPVVRSSTPSGLQRLEGLSEIQRAVVLSEILGPPVSSGRKSAFHLQY